LLISKGHRRIAFFTDFSAITSVMDRDAGYRAALEEADIDYDESLVCGPQVMRHSRLNYDYTLEHLLKLPEPVTAIFGINDNTIWAALQAANVQGLQVPRDLEIAGFFDSPIPMGVQTHFIRVVQAKYEMGRAAVQVILDRLSGDTSKEPRHVLIPPTVVE
jgi:DNA-binding LacI/PurR family transcriptional regulator